MNEQQMPQGGSTYNKLTCTINDDIYQIIDCLFEFHVAKVIGDETHLCNAVKLTVPFMYGIKSDKEIAFNKCVEFLNSLRLDLAA